MKNNSTIAEPYKRKIGEVTFIVSSLTNPKATKTADELMLQILENRTENIKERNT